MMRLVIAILIATAVFGVGYGFWQTLEPIEDAGPAPTADTRIADRLLEPGHVSVPVPMKDLEAAGERVRTAVRHADEGRQVVQEVHQDISREAAALKDIDPQAALKVVREEGKAALSELERKFTSEGVRRRTGQGRIHPSGAPPADGGGKPGTARQPGIDWYRGGGE